MNSSLLYPFQIARVPGTEIALELEAQWQAQDKIQLSIYLAYCKSWQFLP